MCVGGMGASLPQGTRGPRVGGWHCDGRPHDRPVSPEHRQVGQALPSGTSNVTWGHARKVKAVGSGFGPIFPTLAAIVSFLETARFRSRRFLPAPPLLPRASARDGVGGALGCRGSPGPTQVRPRLLKGGLHSDASPSFENGCLSRKRAAGGCKRGRGRARPALAQRRTVRGHSSTRRLRRPRSSRERVTPGACVGRATRPLTSQARLRPEGAWSSRPSPCPAVRIQSHVTCGRRPG